MAAPFLLAAALRLAAAAPAAPETPAATLPRGEIVAKVVCEADASESYALYLPSRFSLGKSWPVLYVLDPRKRGAVAAERFRAAAEKFGWILASSNNSMSDGPMAPTIASVRAMWDDTHRSLPIDAARVYATGFSGGARAACLVAQKAAGQFAGVIGVGAGYAEGAPPAKEQPFVYFGAVGNLDFNYREMRQLEDTLASLGGPHRLAVYDGPHSWPPEDVCLRAVEWMELAAMRKGSRPRDAALAEEGARREAAAAAALEAAGKRGEALARYRELVTDFDGLADVAAARAAVERLEKDGAARRELDDQAKLERREEKTFEELAGKLLEALRAEDPIPATRVAQELRIPSLLHAAASEKESEKLSAKRILAGLFVQTAFYLPRDYLARRDARRAALCAALSAEIRPDRAAEVYYDFACLQAQAGERRGALASLKTAVDKGFHDVHLLETDPDLASVRSEDDFAKVLQSAKKSG
jgi:predicted esterase